MIDDIASAADEDGDFVDYCRELVE